MPALTDPPRLVWGFALVCRVFVLIRKARQAPASVEMGFVFTGGAMFDKSVLIHVFILQG